jgi:hypothetical protein
VNLHTLPSLYRIDTAHLPLTATAVDQLVDALQQLPGVAAAGPIDPKNRKSGAPQRGVWLAVRGGDTSGRGLSPSETDTVMALAVAALNVAAETAGIGVEFGYGHVSTPGPWQSPADDAIAHLDALQAVDAPSGPLDALYRWVLDREADADLLSHRWRTEGVPDIETPGD